MSQNRDLTFLEDTGTGTFSESKHRTEDKHRIEHDETGVSTPSSVAGLVPPTGTFDFEEVINIQTDDVITGGEFEVDPETNESQVTAGTTTHDYVLTVDGVVEDEAHDTGDAEEIPQAEYWPLITVFVAGGAAPPDLGAIVDLNFTYDKASSIALYVDQVFVDEAGGALDYCIDPLNPPVSEVEEDEIVEQSDEGAQGPEGEPGAPWAPGVPANVEDTGVRWSDVMTLISVGELSLKGDAALTEKQVGELKKLAASKDIGLEVRDFTEYRFVRTGAGYARKPEKFIYIKFPTRVEKQSSEDYVFGTGSVDVETGGAYIVLRWQKAEVFEYVESFSFRFFHRVLREERVERDRWVPFYVNEYIDDGSLLHPGIDTLKHLVAKELTRESKLAAEYERAIKGMILDVLPIVGTIRSFTRAVEAGGDVDAWARFAVSAAGDASMLIGSLAKAASASTKIGTASAAARALQIKQSQALLGLVSLQGNLTIARVEAARGNDVGVAGAAVSVLLDLFQLHTVDPKILKGSLDEIAAAVKARVKEVENKLNSGIMLSEAKPVIRPDGAVTGTPPKRGAEVKAKATAAAESIAPTAGNYRGGRHGTTKGPVGDNLFSHHTPAKSVNGLPIDKGPAIQMDLADHITTASHGSQGTAGILYRAKQKTLINNNRFGEAIQMDIDDIRSKFGTKYGSFRHYCGSISKPPQKKRIAVLKLSLFR